MGLQLYAPLLDARAQTADQSHLMKTNVLAAWRKEMHNTTVHNVVSFGVRLWSMYGERLKGVIMCGQ